MVRVAAGSAQVRDTSLQLGLSVYAWHWALLVMSVAMVYLYEAAIGTKEGLWRTRRYVMTRRLAPLFKLDPTGFSGYLFVTTQLLESAIQNPNKAVKEFENGRLGTVVEDAQLPLEFDS